MAAVTVQFGAKDVGLAATMQKLQKSLGKIETNATKASQRVSSGFGSMMAAGAKFATGVGAVVVSMQTLRKGFGVLADGVKNASDLAESANAVNVSFGDAAEGVAELGRSAAETLGLSQSEFNALAVSFSAFAQTVAGEGGDVVGTIDQLTTRSADFASVMNLEVPEAANVFQSALAGQTEPLRRFGIDMSAATVEAHALAVGISDGSGEMTEAQKVQARYSLLMQQTAKFAGDFANTSDGLANSQRILGAQLKDLSAELGEMFMPMLQAATNLIKDTVIPAIRSMLASLTGGEPEQFAQRMKQAFNDIVNFAIGVFKKPDLIVAPLKTALEIAFKNAGNFLVNGLKTAADFFKNIFASEIPSLVGERIRLALSAGFAQAASVLLTQLGNAIAAFDQAFGLSVSGVMKFLKSQLGGTVLAFAKDFAQAMTNPAAFAAKQLTSALAKSVQDGADTYTSEFESATGNIMQRAGQGFKAVADQFGTELEDNGAALTEEMGRVLDKTTVFKDDVFDAAGSAEQLADEIEKIVEYGKQFRKDVEETQPPKMPRPAPLPPTPTAPPPAAAPPPARGGGFGGGRGGGRADAGDMRQPPPEAGMMAEIEAARRAKKIDPRAFSPYQETRDQSIQAKYEKALSEGRLGQAEIYAKKMRRRGERFDIRERITEEVGGGERLNFKEMQDAAIEMAKELEGGQSEFGRWSDIMRMSSDELEDYIDGMLDQIEEDKAKKDLEDSKPPPEDQVPPDLGAPPSVCEPPAPEPPACEPPAGKDGDSPEGADGDGMTLNDVVTELQEIKDKLPMQALA